MSNALPYYEPGKFKVSKVLPRIYATPSAGLPIMHISSTLEGEGIFIGLPKVFVRVAGCAVGCSWCDTKHSWAVEPGKNSNYMGLADVVKEIDRVGSSVRDVSITGGEPMHYPAQVKALCILLQERGYRVNLETSGLIIDNPTFSVFNSVCMDIKTPSSTVDLQEINVALIKELVSPSFPTGNIWLKVVISSQEDLDWLEATFWNILLDWDINPVVLTPCADNTKGRVPDQELCRITQMILDWNKRYNIRIITQQHKILDLV